MARASSPRRGACPAPRRPARQWCRRRGSARRRTSRAVSVTVIALRQAQSIGFASGVTLVTGRQLDRREVAVGQQEASASSAAAGDIRRRGQPAPTVPRGGASRRPESPWAGVVVIKFRYSSSGHQGVGADVQPGSVVNCQRSQASINGSNLAVQHRLRCCSISWPVRRSLTSCRAAAHSCGSGCPSPTDDMLALQPGRLFGALARLPSPRAGRAGCFMANSRFCNCERSFWQVTTMPLGIWVRRTAVEFFCTFWPPAPADGYTSILQVVGVDLDLDIVLEFGHAPRPARTRCGGGRRVERRDAHQAVGARLGIGCSRRRWGRACARVALLMPASSPSVRSMISVFQPRVSAQRVYIAQQHLAPSPGPRCRPRGRGSRAGRCCCRAGRSAPGPVLCGRAGQQGARSRARPRLRLRCCPRLRPVPAGPQIAHLRRDAAPFVHLRLQRGQPLHHALARGSDRPRSRRPPDCSVSRIIRRSLPAKSKTHLDLRDALVEMRQRLL